MGKKEYQSRKFGSFNVHGCRYRNDGMKMTRIQWIKKYVVYGSRFALEREPDNEHDKNAIKIRHLLKSGKRMMIGYVPRKLAVEWAPLMDELGWSPEIFFQIKFIAEKDNEEKDIMIGDCTGLKLRYPLR